MKKLMKKQQGLKRRHTRVRGKVAGTAECPRLCVTRSNKNLYVQFVDDVAGKSICGISTHSADFKKVKRMVPLLKEQLNLANLLQKLLLIKRSRKLFLTEAEISITGALRLWPKVLAKAD